MISNLRAELVDLLWDDSYGLNELAWDIATADEGRDLELAFKAAYRASELTDHQNAMILDTVARVYYEQGELEQAVHWQRRAVEHDRNYHPEIRAALEKYEAEQAD